MRAAGRSPSLPKDTLGARCLAPCDQSCDGRSRVSSPALAPASGYRSCPATLSEAEAPSAIAMRTCLAEAVSVADPAHSGLGLAPVCHSSVSVRCPARPVTLRRALLKRACLQSAKTFCRQSLDERVDKYHRHLRDKNHHNFKALRLFVPVDLYPEDKMRLRRKRSSDNACKP